MRQAVVIIHGIGEQRPMETLRGFVAGVLGVSAPTLANRVFSKPDRISDTLELRRLNVLPGQYGEEVALSCETDFYELYWQHLMQGTGWRPVLEWTLYWLFCPWKLNTRLRTQWVRVVTIILLIIGVIILLVPFMWPVLPIRLLGKWVAIILSVPLVVLLVALLRWITFGRVERFALGYLGDAVRYLNPDPPNVEARRAIRTAGLTLLRGLHEDKLRRYERIILVGHSLGSVIAYDLITWFWQEQHHHVEIGSDSRDRETVSTYPLDPNETEPVPNENNSPLKELTGDLRLNDNKNKPDELATFRSRQWALWQKYQEKGLPWRITDLVTLGSPLAHADVLLVNGDKEALDLGKAQREFPSCPPAQEDSRDDKLLWRKYDDKEERQLIRILHHGAPFAITRWTNLYFPGDIIGGPVAHLFCEKTKDKDGHCLLREGINDVELSPPPNSSSAARFWWSHTRYWNYREENACRELRKALSLCEAEDALKCRDHGRAKGEVPNSCIIKKE